MRDEILESLEWFEVMQCPEAFNCIYVWKNKVNGKTYVGKAVKLHERRYGHLRAKDDYYFHKSLRKRGAEGYKLAIIVKDVPTEELGDIERYYIDVLDSLNKNGKGYNIAEGGDGGNSLAGKTDEEKKEIGEKISKANKGKKHSEETKQKLSESHKGEKNPNYGKKASEETKQKLSEGKKGEKAYQCRKVICITNGEIFDYIKQAKEKYGVNSGSIVECCNGNNKSAGVIDGKPAIWMYLEDYEKLSEEEVNKIKNQEVPNKGRAKMVICLNTGVIYESTHEAERRTKVNRHSIGDCCRGKFKSAGKDENGNKLVWMFLEDYQKLTQEEIDEIKISNRKK